MRSRRVVILGAGVTGLASAIALARDGHDVSLVERDPWMIESAEEAPLWPRAGIPHFHQPHAMTPGARKALVDHFQDVYEALIRAGAWNADIGRKLTGPRLESDEELQYLAVRRPLIEWALRRAASAESRVNIVERTNVVGLILEGRTCAGVKLDSGELHADVVVDAMGRRSPVRTWVTEGGLPCSRQHRSDCGVIYYSRYYRLHPGQHFADGPWLLGPRGDLGYMSYSTFPGDCGTFAAVFSVPTGVSDLKGLRHEAAFEAAVASIPGFAPWTDREIAEPFTPVLAMGGLQNTLDEPEAGAPVGLFPAGDALAHTDPVLSHGVAFGLLHAIALARALRDHATEADAGAAYRAGVLPALRERYQLATDLDAQRLRLWTGGPVSLRQKGDYALFTFAAGGLVALHDPEVLRVFVRRMGLLDSTRVLDENLEMRERLEARYLELMQAPRAPQGPDRAAMLALIEAANAGTGIR